MVFEQTGRLFGDVLATTLGLVVDVEGVSFSWMVTRTR